jgi:hypothetical protein
MQASRESDSSSYTYLKRLLIHFTTNQLQIKIKIVPKMFRQIVGVDVIPYGAGYTSDFVHDFMCDLLQNAAVIWCLF